MNSQEMIELCQKHTIYEWSSIESVNPIPVAKAQGVYFWTPEGKRFIDFNSQLMCKYRPCPSQSHQGDEKCSG